MTSPIYFHVYSVILGAVHTALLRCFSQTVHQRDESHLAPTAIRQDAADPKLGLVQLISSRRSSSCEFSFTSEICDQQDGHTRLSLSGNSNLKLIVSTTLVSETEAGAFGEYMPRWFVSLCVLSSENCHRCEFCFHQYLALSLSWTSRRLRLFLSMGDVFFFFSILSLSRNGPCATLQSFRGNESASSQTHSH